MSASEGSDAFAGPGGRGARAGVLVGVGAAVSFVLFARGVGAKESCSAEVGSVETASGGLALPCDLVGGLTAVAVLGCVAVITVALVSGASRSWTLTGSALAAVVAILAVYLVAIGTGNFL